jgi:hypothetical protein
VSSWEKLQSLKIVFWKALHAAQAKRSEKALFKKRRISCQQARDM